MQRGHAVTRRDRKRSLCHRHARRAGLGADFSHPTYANPAAPKGGRLTQGVLGAFDSLNPLIVMGLPAANIRNYVIESLLARGYDEPFTLYGLLARTVATDAARTFVVFDLDPAAHFSDGKPVTPEDVIFSWKILRDKGRPNHRTYYAKVVKAEIVGERAVRFDLTGANDRELPLILGLMPVLARHAIDPATFENTSFTPPIGTGPYIVSEVKPGDSVTFKRNPNYWGRDLPINRGLWNFDEIRYDYYRDGNTYFEAFKKGLYDARSESDPRALADRLQFPGDARRQGSQGNLPLRPAQGHAWLGDEYAAFAICRRPRARGAQLICSTSSGSITITSSISTAAPPAISTAANLSAHGVPANARERELLKPFPGVVRADIMQGKWSPPKTDGSGRDRKMLRHALGLFRAAGYAIKGTTLTHLASGRPFGFEILCNTRDQERVALAYTRSLKLAGIDARVRSVDATQFERRRIAFDFDMMEYLWDQSLSPGNEQLFYWGSAAADQQGTRNYMGVKSKAIDAMIAAMLSAQKQEDFVSAIRALDRVLLSGFYVVPLYFPPLQWVARWTRVEHPQHTSLYGYLPETWWQAEKS